MSADTGELIERLRAVRVNWLAKVAEWQEVAPGVWTDEYIERFTPRLEDEAADRIASLEAALEEARKNAGLLLQDAANKGEEPDVLMLELAQERVRADRAEEAFSICKQELDKARKALILMPMAERVAELPEFMTALSEWGCEDPNEQAKSITEFLNSLVGLREYLSSSKQKDGE